MRLYEHEGKKTFKRMGIAVPTQLGLIRFPEELDVLDLPYPLMLKCQLLVGGRGKAGGVQKAADLAEAKSLARRMLDLSIAGHRTGSLLVEEVIPPTSSCYLGVTINPDSFNVIVVAGAKGGIDIEKTVVDNPESILRRELSQNDPELPEPIARELALFLNNRLREDIRDDLQATVSRLYATFQRFDCRLAEVNPLIISEDARVVAADAKVIIDDNALYRQQELLDLLGIEKSRHELSEPTPDEIRAREAGFVYVDLVPENSVKDPGKLYVGLVPGGAGYGILSIDETANIGDRFFDGQVVPINFMDSGGGPSREQVAKMFHLLMDKELCDLIITSRFGGISSCEVFIKGLIDCLRSRTDQGKRMIPVYGRMVGTDLPGAIAFLKRAREETPKALEDAEIVGGNQIIMAEVIKEAIKRVLKKKRAQSTGKREDVENTGA